MSSSISTILIIGGTSGIGEAFAQRFHSMGKKVIITGRRQERLKELESQMESVKSYVMDNTDLSALPSHVEHLTKTFPDIDTVWVNSGIQEAFKFDDPTSSSDSKILNEINTNVSAPMLLARHFIPFLLKSGKEGNFMITTSGLAFVPVGAFPIYCPTKAFVHHFLVGLRQQMAGTNVNVIEIAPPRVETDLDAAHKEISNTPAMSLDEYTAKTFEVLDNNKASELKEVAVGFADMGAKAWRQSIGGLLEAMKIGG
ncbi:hypothetical protein PMZ80_008869 [Knufia obscura]|uniref:Uncharacterized protein n=1 Tax=Knufia obscura TaxID=1635080 RepID=A0ABR0REP7_9EURO|nr:hypothetical protein PMZ80_008869 [Knufia obscura]